MTLRTLTWMARGKADGELDLYFLYIDDAWERSARLLAMTHNLIVKVHNLFAKQPARFQDADHFNDSLGAPGDSDSDPDGYPWAHPDEAANEETPASPSGQDDVLPPGGHESPGGPARQGERVDQSVREG